MVQERHQVSILRSLNFGQSVFGQIWDYGMSEILLGDSYQYAMHNMYAIFTNMADSYTVRVT
jgi:hypothetical protein